MEIYNESLRDLLCPSTPPSKIQLLDDKKAGGFMVKGLREEEIDTPEKVGKGLGVGLWVWVGVQDVWRLYD